MAKLGSRSFLNALGTVAYVSVVATIMKNGEKIFGNTNSAIIPVAILTLLVLSAAITGALILGKPILMYLDNQKRDAIKLFFYTLAWLALAVVILLAYCVLFK